MMAKTSRKTNDTSPSLSLDENLLFIGDWLPTPRPVLGGIIFVLIGIGLLGNKHWIAGLIFLAIGGVALFGPPLPTKKWAYVTDKRLLFKDSDKHQISIPLEKIEHVRISVPPST
jgi:hypothetical protein